MNKENQHGLLPVIDGPWKGGQVDHSCGTFEAEGDDIGCPVTSGFTQKERVRYYRQQDSEGSFVWSVAIPANAAELLQDEMIEAKRIAG